MTSVAMAKKTLTYPMEKTIERVPAVPSLGTGSLRALLEKAVEEQTTVTTLVIDPYMEIEALRQELHKQRTANLAMIGQVAIAKRSMDGHRIRCAKIEEDFTKLCAGLGEFSAAMHQWGDLFEKLHNFSKDLQIKSHTHYSSKRSH